MNSGQTVPPQPCASGPPCQRRLPASTGPWMLEGLCPSYLLSQAFN